ncbi:unnamed protein product [Albugo candida]|uniref:GRIP domain-containing protein n=1 Tax=Albugo candida TaxID=65357 RepID=A0A024FY26_9STRA|nr:unnamed protein product [Albugo candida]|eukprot:CCI39484.1 unnamed protein product [Albugo candida]
MDNLQEEKVSTDEVVSKLKQENQLLLRKLHDVVRRYRSLQEQYQCLVQETSAQGRENQFVATEASPTKMAASLSEHNSSIKKLEDEKHNLIDELKRVVGTCRAMHKQLQEAREENERLGSPNKPADSMHKSPLQREAGSFRLPILSDHSSDDIVSNGCVNEAVDGSDICGEGSLSEMQTEERDQVNILLQENERLRLALDKEKEKMERNVFVSCEKVSELEKTLEQAILARDSLRESHHDEIASLQQRIDYFTKKENSWDTEKQLMESEHESLKQQLFKGKTHSIALEKELMNFQKVMLEGEERTSNTIHQLQVEKVEYARKIASLEQERDIYALQVSEQQETINEIETKYQTELSRSNQLVNEANENAAGHTKRLNQLEDKLQDAVEAAASLQNKLEVEMRSHTHEKELLTQRFTKEMNSMRLEIEDEHQEKSDKMRKELSTRNAFEEESVLRVCEAERQLQELRQQLDERDSDLQTFSQEKENIVKANAETVKQLREDFDKELEQYREKQRDLEHMEQTLREKLAELKIRSQNASAKESILQQDLIRVEEVLRERESELYDQKSLVSDLQQQLMTERMSVNACKQQLQSQLDRVNELTTEKITSSEEIERLQSELEELITASTLKMQIAENEHQNAMEMLIQKYELELQKEVGNQAVIKTEHGIIVQEREKLLMLREEESDKRQEEMAKVISKYEVQQGILRKEFSDTNARERQSMNVRIHDLTEQLTKANDCYAVSQSRLQERMEAWMEERQAAEKEYEGKLGFIQKEHETRAESVRLELESKNEDEVQALEKKIRELQEEILGFSQTCEKLKAEEQSRINAWTREKEIMQRDLHDHLEATRADLLQQHDDELKKAILMEKDRYKRQLESLKPKYDENEALIARIAELETQLTDTLRLSKSEVENSRKELIENLVVDHERDVGRLRMELVRKHQKDCERMLLTRAELEGHLTQQNLSMKVQQTTLSELRSELNSAKESIQSLQNRIVEVETRSEEDLERVISSQNTLEEDLSRRLQEKAYVVEELEKASKLYEDLYKERIQSLQEAASGAEIRFCNLQDRFLALENDAASKASALDVANVTMKQMNQEIKSMNYKTSLERQAEVELTSQLARALEQFAMSNEEIEALKLRLQSKMGDTGNCKHETLIDSSASTEASDDVTQRTAPRYENIEAHQKHFAKLKARLHETLERVAYLEENRENRVSFQADTKQSDIERQCQASEEDIRLQLNEIFARYKALSEERKELLEILSNPEHESEYDCKSATFDGKTILTKLLSQDRNVEETRARALHLISHHATQTEEQAKVTALQNKLMDDRDRILILIDEEYRKSSSKMNELMKKQDATTRILSVQLIEAQDQATSYAHQIASIETQLQTLPGINQALEESKGVEETELSTREGSPKIDCVSILEEVRENLRNAEEYEAKMSAISKSTERLRERLASATEGIGSSDCKSERFEIEIETLNQNLMIERNEKEDILMQLQKTEKKLVKLTLQNQTLEEKMRDSMEQWQIDVREHQANRIEWSRRQSEVEAIKAENVRMVFEVAKAADVAAVSKMDVEAMECQLKERSNELIAIKNQYKQDQEEHKVLCCELREQAQASSQQRNEDQNRLVSEMALLQEKYEEVKSHCEITSEQLETKNGIITEQKTKIEELAVICKRLKALLNDMKRKHAIDLQNNIDRQQAEMKEALDRAKEKIIQMENQAQMQHEELDEAKCKLEESQQLFRTQQSNHLVRERRRKEEFDTLCRLNDEFSFRLEECDRRAMETFLLQKEEWEVFRAQRKGICVEKEEKEIELVKLQTEIHQSNETQRASAEAQKREHDAMRIERDQMLAKLDKEAQGAEAAREALDSYKKRAHTALKKATKETRESLRDALKRVTEMEEQLMESQARIRSLEEELHAAKKAVECINTKYEEKKLDFISKDEELRSLEDINTRQSEDLRLSQSKEEQITNLERQIEALQLANLTAAEEIKAVQSAHDSDLFHINQIVQAKSDENQALVQELRESKQELTAIQIETSPDPQSEENNHQTAHIECPIAEARDFSDNPKLAGNDPLIAAGTGDDANSDPGQGVQPHLTAISDKYKEEHIESFVVQTKQEVCRKDLNVVNVEYLRNIVIKYLSSQNQSEREHLIPVLATILKFNHEENDKVTKSMTKKAQETSVLGSVMSIFGPQKSLQSPKPLAVPRSIPADMDTPRLHSMEMEEEDEMSLLNPFASREEPLGW